MSCQGHRCSHTHVERGPLAVITVRAATAPDALHLAQVITDAVKPLAAARREQQ